MPRDPERPGNDPRPSQLDYPLAQVRQQFLKTADYFSSVLEAHGHHIVAASACGVTVVVARGVERVLLEEYVVQQGIAHIQQGPPAHDPALD